MKFAKRVFLFAGVYGLVVLLPQYFFEAQIGRDYPPPITHPEHFYGFIGVAVAWQVAFLIVSTDPVRYRPMMVAAILEKLSFGVAAILLFSGGRIPAMMFAFAMIDLFLAGMFSVAFVRTAATVVK
jgi:hypothetical protein